MGCQASTPTAQKMRPLWQMLGRDLARPYPRVSMVPHTSLPSSQVSALEAPVSPPAPEPKEPPAGLPHPSLLSTSGLSFLSFGTIDILGPMIHRYKEAVLCIVVTQ